MSEATTDANQAADSSTEATTEALNDQNASGAQTASNSEEGGAGKPTPFHEHPRFKALIEEKNSLKQRIDELQSQVASTINKQTEISPDEEMAQDLVKLGIKEDVAKGLAKTFTKASAKVTEGRVAPVEKAALQNRVDGWINDFAKENPDFKDLQPKMYEEFMALDQQSQALVSASPKGLELLYSHVKRLNHDEEVKQAREKGIQEGIAKKKEKVAGSPTSGASTSAPKSSYSDEEIAAMSPAEYKKNRNAIFTSRGMRRPT